MKLVFCQEGWDSQEIKLAWDFNLRKDSKPEGTGVVHLPAVPMGRIQYMAEIIFLAALEEFLKKIETDKSKEVEYLEWSNRFLSDYAFLVGELCTEIRLNCFCCKVGS